MPVFVFQQLTGAPPDYYFGVPPLLTTLFVLALGAAVLRGGVVSWLRWRSPGSWPAGICSASAPEPSCNESKHNVPDRTNRKR